MISRVLTTRLRIGLKRILHAALGSTLLLTGAASVSEMQAAEQLVIQAGPLKQSVAIADLEAFAETGTPPPSLQLYKPLLTPDVQRLLADRLAINPELGDKVVKDLLQSQSGVRLLDSLEMIAPDVSIRQLRVALAASAHRGEGLSLLGTLKALPQESVTVDALAVVTLASQLNFSYLQTQSMSTVLEQQLQVEEQAPLQTNMNPSQAGPFEAQNRSLLLRDTKRDRMIPVELYWSDYSHGPLIVISHGFGADRKFLSYLADHFASYGFVVASIEHPGSNVAALSALMRESSSYDQPSRILPASEFIDRPKDVSFVLDHLSWLNVYSHVLGGKLNTRNVSVVGHSMGGYTALVLAGAKLSLPELQQYCDNQRSIDLAPADWLQCAATDLPRSNESLGDARVSQITLLNPIVGQLFGQHGLQSVRVPTLMLSSTEDPVTPAAAQQLWPFDQLPAEKYLMTAIRGTHLSVGDPEHLNPALTENPFLRERPGHETEHVRQFVKGASLAFVMQETPQAERYEPFLSASYAESLSTAELPLRFNTDLPSSLSQWLQVTTRPRGGTNTPLRQLASAIHLEVLGAWNQFAIAQDNMLHFLSRNQLPTTPMMVGVYSQESEPLSQSKSD